MADQDIERVADRAALMQEALKHGIDEAIDYTDDVEATEIAQALAEAGVEDLPHIHNWAPLAGSMITVADSPYQTYLCACGESKVDRWRG